MGNTDVFYEFQKLAKENNIHRLDDDFLRRFLIGRNYNIPKALKAICNYQSFIVRKRDKWLKLEKNVVECVLTSQVIDVLEETGLQGQKVVWIRLENWDPDIFTADDILKVSGLLCELIYTQTKEVKCFDIIMDMKNFSLKQLYSLSRKFAKRMIFYMSECLPMELMNIYVVRQPKIFWLSYAIYKPFIEERMKEIIYISGYNYEPLMKGIGRLCLPAEFGGTYKNYKPIRWINIMYKNDLSLSGYEFYEKSISNT